MEWNYDLHTRKDIELVLVLLLTLTLTKYVFKSTTKAYGVRVVMLYVSVPATCYISDHMVELTLTLTLTLHAMFQTRI